MIESKAAGEDRREDKESGPSSSMTAIQPYLTSKTEGESIHDGM
jgi:hypothetical protein